MNTDDLRLFPAGRGAVTSGRAQLWPPHGGMRRRGARAVPSAVCVGGSSVAGDLSVPSTLNSILASTLGCDPSSAPCVPWPSTERVI